MDKLRALQNFVAIAEAGSLTEAARRQGCSLPAVVRLLAGLESELGTRLFQRTTRRIALTDAGRRYLERSRAVCTLVGEADAELRAEQTVPRGRMSITAPVFFGTRHVTRAVTAFIQRYPEVEVELQLHDRVVNLLEEGIDVGIRIGELADSSLIARLAGTMRRVTVAAPSYLAAHGRPEQPKELAQHNCIRFTRPGTASWGFRANGKPLHVAVTGNLILNQALAAADACSTGLGIGNFFAYQVAPELASGALEVLLPSFETAPRPIHVVYPEARLLPARARVFIDFILRHLQAEQRVWQPDATERRARAVGRRAPRGTSGRS